MESLPKTQPQTLGSMIDAYRNLYDQRAELNAQVKALTGELESLDRQLVERLESVGLNSAKSDHAQVWIDTKTYPVVEDWNSFYRYIAENEAFYLLERRAARVAYSDTLQTGEEIPGVKPVEIRKIVSRKS